MPRSCRDVTLSLPQPSTPPGATEQRMGSVTSSPGCAQPCVYLRSRGDCTACGRLDRVCRPAPSPVPSNPVLLPSARQPPQVPQSAGGSPVARAPVSTLPARLDATDATAWVSARLDSRHLQFIRAFVSCCGCDKLPHAEWLQTTPIYYLTFL